MSTEHATRTYQVAETRDLTLATLMLCTEYVEVSSAGRPLNWVYDPSIVLAEVKTLPPTRPGRSALCIFVLGFMDSEKYDRKLLLAEGDLAYRDNPNDGNGGADRLFVSPYQFDLTKKQIVEGMHEARRKREVSSDE